MTVQPSFSLVSVIIPCYAQGHFLRDAIESALAQSYRPIEIIVVNDGAPDSALIEAVVAPYGRQVTYVRQANTGLSGARNTGLKYATGDFVVCLDADDRLLPKAIAHGVDAYAEHPDVGLVWGFNQLIDVHGDALDNSDRTYNFDGSYVALLEKNTIGPPVVVMFRRSTLMAAGAFATSLRHSEDYEMYMRLVREHGAHCHGHVVSEYRLHESNMSKDSPGMLIGNLQALKAQDAWVRDDPVLRRARERGRRNARLMYDAQPRLDRLGEDVRAGRWLPAFGTASVLLVKYPQRFLSLVVRRVRRALGFPPET